MAQQPFQDTKGEGTLLINGGGFAQINVADPSIRLGYLYDDTGNNWTYGFNLSGKLTGTKAGFINNNRVAPDAQFAFTIGRKYPFTKKFEAEKIPVSQQLLTDFQVILQKEKILDERVSLPSRDELQALLRRVEVLTPDQSLPDPIALADYLMRINNFCDAVLTNDTIKNSRKTENQTAKLY